MKIITTTYDEPDLDGYGCAVAYAEFLNSQGKKAEAHIWGTPLLEVQWLLDAFNIPAAAGPIDDPGADVVLLDASEPADLPGNIKPDQVIEIIDHRKVSSVDKFKNAVNQIELVGAAATLVAERFKKAGVEPTRESAALLYGGIISNTQNFTALTTDRDREMAAWLADIARVPDNFAQQMFLAKSDLSGQRLKEEIIKDNKVFDMHGYSVGIGQLEIIGVTELLKHRQSEIESILQKIKNEENCDFTFINLRDLDAGLSYIVCVDDKTSDLLSDMTDTEWKDGVGVSRTLTLRKQIASWIKDKLKE